MIKIGSFDAKTHFSEIIQNVLIKGNEYLVTKNGKPMARIITQGSDESKVEDIIASILKIKGKNKASQKEIKSFINEGRKY